jgi:hypothetical protein
VISSIRLRATSRKRPSLPRDVAALAGTLEADRTVLQLINLSPFDTKKVIVQAGAFGEHRFTKGRYSHRTSEYPGQIEAYAAPPVEQETRTVSVQNAHLQIVLPPATEITLDLGTTRFVNRPSAALPWAT